MSVYFKYYVIKFPWLPYKDCERNVCVPESWVNKDLTDEYERVQVAYPSKKSPTTKTRVKNRKEYDKEWTFYWVFLRYWTDSYIDADRFARAENKRKPIEQIILDDKRKAAARRKARQGSSAKVTLMKALQLKNKRKNVPIEPTLKRKLPLDFIEINEECSRIDAATESASEASNCSSKQLETLNEDELPHEHFSALQSRSSEIIVATPTAVNADDNITCSQSSRKDGTSPNQVNTFRQSPERSDGEHLIPIQKQRTPEVTLERSSGSNEIDQISRSESNTKRIPAVSTPSILSIQICQASKHPIKENPSPALKQCTPEVDKSNKPNEVEQDDKSSHPQIDTNATPRLCLTNSVNQSGRAPKYTHQSSLRYGDYYYPDPRVQVCPQTNAMDASAMKNSLNLSNQSCRPSEQPELYHDSRIPRLVAQKSVGVNSISQITQSLGHANNVTPVRNTVNLANLPSNAGEGSHKMPLSTASVPSLYQTPYEREIFTERSTEANSVDLRAYSQSYAQHPSTVQNTMNLQNLIVQNNNLIEHIQKTQPVAVNRSCSQRDLRNIKYPGTNQMSQRVRPQDVRLTQKDILQQKLYARTINASRPTGVTDMDGRVHSQTFEKSPLPNVANTMPCSSNLANQFGQSFEHPYKTQIPTASLQVPHIYENQPSRPKEINVIHSKAYPQGSPQHITSAVQNYSNPSGNSSCSCQCSCGKKSSSNIAEHSDRNLSVQESQFEIITEENSIGQRVHLGNTEKIPSVIENHTSIANRSQNHGVGERLPPTNQDDADQDMVEKIPLERSDGAKYIGQSIHPESVPADRPTAMHSATMKVNHKSPDCRAIAEEVLFKHFTDIFSSIRETVLENSKLLDRERKALTEYSAMLKKVTKFTEDYNEITNGNFKSKKVTFNKKQYNKNQEREKKNDLKQKNQKNKFYNLNDNESENEVDYDHNDKPDEAPKKKRDQKRFFVLPPEYNPKNSRWTLKHRRASLGIIEVMPESRVYIDAFQLLNCKRIAKDHNTFARMLLVEIFSQSALSVCTLTGAKTNTAFNADGTTYVRPGLDEHAKTVLLTYVYEYGRERGWGKFDTKSVLTSIRRKLQQISAKQDILIE